MRYLNFLCFILVLILLLPSEAKPQAYRLDSENSEMTVAGTSTLHDWEFNVLKLTGSANLIFSANELTDIDEMSVSLNIESLKSNKSGMDKNAYESLRKSEFPVIKYIHTRTDEITGNNVISMGLLTIAGVTREVTMNVDYTGNGSQDINFNGILEIKMTDFGIDPPTALLGTIKTGDPVTIQFKARFKQ